MSERVQVVDCKAYLTELRYEGPWTVYVGGGLAATHRDGISELKLDVASQHVAVQIDNPDDARTRLLKPGHKYHIEVFLSEDD